MIPPWEVPTPNKVQALQRTLNREAKENPRWRAWTLWGDLRRRDVLETALTAVLTNAGAAGVDRVTTGSVKADSAAFFDGLQPVCIFRLLLHCRLFLARAPRLRPSVSFDKVIHCGFSA